MPPPDTIDITGSLRGQVSVTPEPHPDECALQLATDNRQSIIEDAKGVAVFAVLLMAIVGIGLLASYESMFDTTASLETRKWAQTMVTAILSGGISFAVGRKMSSK